MSRPVHFEIPADQPERAIAFYQKVFNWKFSKWEGPMTYWMISTGGQEQPGIDGGLIPRMHPGQGVTNTIGVADVDAAVASLTAHGVGWLAYFTDPEGNPGGVMQNDPAAK